MNAEMYVADGDYIQDIEVNDLRNRYLLTKGSTQKMVNTLVIHTHPSRPVLAKLVALDVEDIMLTWHDSSHAKALRYSY